MSGNYIETVSSIVVGHPNKSVSGEVLQVKKTHDDGKVETNYISSVIADSSLNKPKNKTEIDFTCEESIQDRIEYVTHKTRYSSKILNTDEITGESYHEDCPELLLRHIPGSQMIYHPPSGVVYCHNSSLLLYKCICINFMITHKIIPYQLTSLVEKQVYKIKRSNGLLQRGYLEANSGIRVSKTYNKIVANIGFNSDKHQMISDTNPFVEGVILERVPLSSLNKNVFLSDFCQENNISKVTIDFNKFKFTEESISLERQTRPVFADVMSKYNDRLKSYLTSFREHEYLEIIC